MDLMDELRRAQRAVRAWHTVGLKMRDAAIEGDVKAVQSIYSDAAMYDIPFYGADTDPLPCDAPNDGGQAFPSDTDNHTRIPGMTLRDYFAAVALEGMVAARCKVSGCEANLAVQAYALADAMMAEKNKL